MSAIKALKGVYDWQSVQIGEQLMIINSLDFQGALVQVLSKDQGNWDPMLRVKFLTCPPRPDVVGKNKSFYLWRFARITDGCYNPLTLKIKVMEERFNSRKNAKC